MSAAENAAVVRSQLAAIMQYLHPTGILGEGGEVSDEEFVRAHWEYIYVQDLPHNVQTDRYCDWHIAIWSRFLPLNPSTRFILANGTKDEAWAAAAEFTRERLEQIRLLVLEINYLCAADYSDQFGEVSDDADQAQERTRLRLADALADLRKGMREQGYVAKEQAQ